MERAAEDAEKIRGTGGLRAVFRHPVFAGVMAGAFLSNIGNWMENSAANWAVVSAPGLTRPQANLLVEVLNFADFLPALLLSLAAGVIADRVNMRRYLLILQTLACLLGAGLAAAAYKGYASPTVVIAFTFAEGVVWALNGPPWLSVVPHLVPRSELPAAVAASSAQFNLAQAVGPLVAGLLVARMGVAMAFAVNAVTFFPLLVVLWKMPAETKRQRSQAGGISLFRQLSAGLRVVWKHPGLRRLSLMMAVSMFLAAPAKGLLASYVQQRMHGDSWTFGWMQGAIGLGACLAALTVRRVPAYYPRHHLIPLSICVAGVFMMLFTLTTVTWAGFVMLVAMGFFWLMGLNSANAAMQLLAEDESRGRVMSVMMLCTQGLLPLGHLTAGWMAKVMGPEWVMRVMECVLVLASGAFLLWREPAIDAMTKQEQRLGFWEEVWEAVTAQSHRRVPAPVREELARDGATVRAGERNG